MILQASCKDSNTLAKLSFPRKRESSVKIASAQGGFLCHPRECLAARVVPGIQNKIVSAVGGFLLFASHG